MNVAGPPWVFNAFKYCIYGLLLLNVLLFFLEDVGTIDHVYAEGLSLGDVIDVFASTIDTAAWVVLLLLFELETYVLEDDVVRGRIGWSLKAVRLLCYGVITYALYGYVAKLLLVTGVSPIEGVRNLCELADSGRSYMLDELNEYAVLTAANCAELSSATAFWQLSAAPIVADFERLQALQRLAWTDVINAATWLVVVAVLETDVWIAETGNPDGLVDKTLRLAKPILYAVLLGCALYWGIAGDALDFWDAFLWLVAFFCIELNVLSWQQELREEREAGAGSGMRAE